MTQTADLIHKMAEFFKSEEFFEKGEDAKLELSPDDVRCMNEIIKACGNAISRQAVMDALCDGCELFKNGEQTCRSKCEEYHFLATLPPVTPQQKIGYWIDTGSGQECSECHEMQYGYDNYRFYCGNCGARMQEIKE